MKKIISLLLICSILVLTLSSCGTKKEVLRVFNWGDFIADGVLDEFEDLYNCKIIYEVYDSNETMMTKVESGGNYDVVFPSDYAVAMMADKDLLMEIDFSKITNYKDVDPAYLLDAPYTDYCVPYMWGTLGILYNKEMVTDPVDSWGILFDDASMEKYHNQIYMLKGMRDSMGTALMYLGYSMNTADPKEINEAKELLLKQKAHVQGYMTDDVKDKMLGEEGAMALVFSGEGMKAVDDSEGMLGYSIPKEGTNLAIDNVAILKNAQNPELAHKFIDFLCSTDIAMRGAEETGYSSPMVSVREQLPENIKNSPRYPSHDILNKSEIFFSLSEETNALWNAAWIEIRGTVVDDE